MGMMSRGRRPYGSSTFSPTAGLNLINQFVLALSGFQLDQFWFAVIPVSVLNTLQIF